jgi:hypothetical protein
MWRASSQKGDVLSGFDLETSTFATLQVHILTELRDTCDYIANAILVLPPFQIIRRFGFSRCIAFTMHLDIVYI